MTKPITMQQITREALKILNDELDKSHKKKYLAVQTRHGVWLIVARSVYSGDEPRLIKFDERIKVCESQQEAEGFEKLLRS
jgi:hypothetical protein